MAGKRGRPKKITTECEKEKVLKEREKAVFDAKVSTRDIYKLEDLERLRMYRQHVEVLTGVRDLENELCLITIGMCREHEENGRRKKYVISEEVAERLYKMARDAHEIEQEIGLELYEREQEM